MKKIRLPEEETFARIRVFGIGGSGKNATNHMIRSGIAGVEFIVANTDSQDLEQSKAGKKIHLGSKLTRGLGTGMNANIGRTAAEEASDEILEMIKGADLVFVACGMGGGTGTGAGPIVAKIAKELGVLTIAVITRPFSFEGGKRVALAEEGIAELSQNCDAIIVIPNDNILKASEKKTSMADAFAMSDDVLLKAVRGITDLITNPGDINVDFADVRTIMQNSGTALMGIGLAKGASRAEVAVQRATSSPLLDISIRGAQRILFSIASRSRRDISMDEVQTIAQGVTESVDPNARIIFGTSTDKNLRQGEIRVTVIATSFPDVDVIQKNKDGANSLIPTAFKKKQPNQSDDVELIDDTFTPNQTEEDISFDDDDDHDENVKVKPRGHRSEWNISNLWK